MLVSRTHRIQFWFVINALIFPKNFAISNKKSVLSVMVYLLFYVDMYIWIRNALEKHFVFQVQWSSKIECIIYNYSVVVALFLWKILLFLFKDYCRLITAFQLGGLVGFFWFKRVNKLSLVLKVLWLHFNERWENWLFHHFSNSGFYK